MTSRYSSYVPKKLKDGRIVYRTRIRPAIPLQDDDVYVVTQSGDRLETIALTFLGDQSLWWIIAMANNLHGANIAVADGTILRLPIDYVSVINLINS